MSRIIQVLLTSGVINGGISEAQSTNVVSAVQGTVTVSNVGELTEDSMSGRLLSDVILVVDDIPKTTEKINENARLPGRM